MKDLPADLIERLVSEFGYSTVAAGTVANRLRSAAPHIAAAFAQWWSTGQLERIQVEGVSTDELMAKHGLSPIAALLTLDWLRRDPDRAKSALARGHDFVR